MWFFHLADKDVSWNVSLFWTLSIFFFSLLLHSLPRGTKINPASYYCWFRWGKEWGELFVVIAVGSSLGICSDSDDAGRRQGSLRLGAVRWHAFTPVCTVFARLLEDDVQLCALPTSHNAICHDLMISCDLSVLGEMIYKTHCSYFIDIACLKVRCRPHVCFKHQPLPFSAKSQVQNALPSKPLEIHYVEYLVSDDCSSPCICII